MKETKSTITAAITGAVLATSTMLGVDYVQNNSNTDIKYVVTAEEAKVPRQVWSKDSIDKVTDRMDSRLDVLLRVRQNALAKLELEPDNFEVKAELRNIEREIEGLENGKAELGEIKEVLNN